MKFTKNDLKMFLIIVLAILAVGGLFYVGDDLPGIKQIREGYTD